MCTAIYSRAAQGGEYVRAFDWLWASRRSLLDPVSRRTLGRAWRLSACVLSVGDISLMYNAANTCSLLASAQVSKISVFSSRMLRVIAVLCSSRRWFFGAPDAR